MEEHDYLRQRDQPRYHTFAVRGQGEFPRHMLTQDACGPWDVEDARVIEARRDDPRSDYIFADKHGPKTNRVQLVTRFSTPPSVRKWEAAGWSVVFDPATKRPEMTTLTRAETQRWQEAQAAAAGNRNAA